MKAEEVERAPIRTEQLAYWFFRLNGCLTIPNFLVHGERRGHEGTDADLLAVRFPHRSELARTGNPMKDHSAFLPIMGTTGNGLVDIMIVEVKKSRCCLNGPWTDPERHNMERVLYAIGALPEDQIRAVASALYLQNCYVDERYRFRLFALGQHVNDTLGAEVVQLTWEEVSGWIYDRLHAYRLQKAQHEQWDDLGKELYELMVKRWDDRVGFVAEVQTRLAP